MKRILTIAMLIATTGAFANNTSSQNPPPSNQQSSQQNNGMKKLDKCPGNPNADCRPQGGQTPKMENSNNQQLPEKK